jgi:hypothetical protein
MHLLQFEATSQNPALAFAKHLHVANSPVHDPWPEHLTSVPPIFVLGHVRLQKRPPLIPLHWHVPSSRQTPLLLQGFRGDGLQGKVHPALTP